MSALLNNLKCIGKQRGYSLRNRLTDGMVRDISLSLCSGKKKGGSLQNGIALAGGCAAIGDLLMPDDLRYIISIQDGTQNSFGKRGCWTLLFYSLGNFSVYRVGKRKGKVQRLHFCFLERKVRFPRIVELLNLLWVHLARGFWWKLKCWNMIWEHNFGWICNFYVSFWTAIIKSGKSRVSGISLPFLDFTSLALVPELILWGQGVWACLFKHKGHNCSK